MTYEEKVKRIYEAMADKTLSYGLFYKFDGKIYKVLPYEESGIENNIDKLKQHFIEIIGHPIHIGVVLDWVEKNTDGDKLSRLGGGWECNNYGRGASGNGYFSLTQQEEIKLATILKRPDLKQPLPLNPTEEWYDLIDFISSLLDGGND